jgi:hypothetical protein
LLNQSNTAAVGIEAVAFRKWIWGRLTTQIHRPS